MPGSWCYINVFRFLFGSHTYFLPAVYQQSILLQTSCAFYSVYMSDSLMLLCNSPFVLNQHLHSLTVCTE